MTRALALPLLDQVRIASPCPMKWEHMAPVGDGERLRHCSRCSLNVHNISGMTGDEAEAFLRSIVPGQRVCGIFWRRPDGMILTRDCPVGLRAARARVARVLTRLAAAAALLVTGAVFARSRDREGRAMTGLERSQPFATLIQWVRGKPVQPPVQIAGDLWIPPPPIGGSKGGGG